MESIILQAKEITSTIKEFQKNLNLVIANIFKSIYPENTIDGYDIDELKAYCLYNCEYDTTPMTTISFVGKNKILDIDNVFLHCCITDKTFTEGIYYEHYYTGSDRSFCYVKSIEPHCGIFINKHVKHISGDDLNKFEEIIASLKELIGGIDKDMLLIKDD
jgi:hypothetical protein